ncbi:MAG: hypothetical protein AB1Z63_07985 [Candidatus Limnocylindrales bacterium]
MATDPWTSFLDWLTTVLVPAWGELIGLLPYVIIAGVAGPILTIIVLMWGWYLIGRRRGKVQRGQAQAVAAPLGDDGAPVYPVNHPYCEAHGLVFPPRAKTCSVDGDPLEVTCPVDGTVREAAIDTCSGCGTKFQLGAASSGSVVLSSDGPPTGGAAVA